MFAYCGNNPISWFDPCGTCKHYWYLLGLVDCEKCKNKSSTTSSFKNPDGSYSLYDNKRTGGNSVFHEQIASVSAAPASFSLADGKFTFGSVEATMLTGGWTLGNVDLSLLNLGRIEASAGLEDNSFALSAMASLWSPSITIPVGKGNMSLSINVGSVGGAFKTGSKGFQFGISGGLGFTISYSE